MNKNLIKGMAIAICAVMTTSFAGCKKSIANNSEGVSDVTIKAVDLGGYNFVIGTKWVKGWGNGEEGESDASDLWLQWRRDFEKDYNCTIEVQPIELYTLFETVGPRLMSGEKVADLLECQLFDVENFRHTGLLTAWQSVPGINMEDWKGTAGDVNTFNGKTYLVETGVSTVNTGVLVNRSMLKRLNLEDPFQLVADKKWTLAKMRQLAIAATADNGDGIWDKNDQYGVGMWNNFITGMLKTNGVNIIEQKDGVMQYGLSNTKTVDILTALKDFALTDKSEYPLNNDTHAEYVQKFIEGKILFVTCPANFPSQYEEMMDMKDDYGYLPCPTLEEGQDYSFLLEYWTSGLAIPSSNTDLDKLSVLMNSIKSTVSKTKGLYWDEISRRYRDHKETVDILKMLTNNPKVDYYANQSFIAPAITMLISSVYNPTIEPASSLESLREQMEKSIIDYYKNDPDFGAK